MDQASMQIIIINHSIHSFFNQQIIV